MSDDPRFPEMESFPPEGGVIPSMSLGHIHEGFGLITSQDADDLHEITLTIALGPIPQNGFVCVAVDAEGARGVAKHLLHLADYAELGVEAEHYE